MMLEKFLHVRHLQFYSRSQVGSQMDWNVNGVGVVNVRTDGQQVDFDEIIELDNGRCCHDKKRWQCDGQLLRFYRYRNDCYEQIFEFLNQNGQWILQEPYWCTPDCYRATLIVEQSSIIFTIYITSTRKNECVQYVYPIS